MDSSQIERFVSAKWDDDIVPQLVDYIRIPNKSPMFDADWVEHGYMDDAVRLMEDWAKAQPVKGIGLKTVENNRDRIVLGKVSAKPKGKTTARAKAPSSPAKKG